MSGVNLTVYKEDHIGKAINLYYPPILIIVGTIGNILSFIVYVKPKYRGRTSPTYIAVMSVLDTIMLFLGLLQYWILFNFAPKSLTDAHCKGMFFVVNFFGNFSHWLIVLFTIDRFLAVCLPVQSVSLRTMHRAKISLVVLGLTAFVKNLHYLWTTDFFFNANTGTAACAFGLRTKTKWVSAYQTFEVTISSILPFIMILVLNTLIIREIRTRRKIFIAAFQKNNTLCSTATMDTGGANTEATTVKNKSFDYPLTKVLLVVSMCFIITTCPLLVFRLYYAKFDNTVDPERTAKYNMWHHVWHKLWYTNNGINFFLYSMFSKLFRQDLKAMFTGILSPTSQSADSATTGQS